MTAPSRYAALFGVFAPLSIATIGGGQAIIADIQRQVVDVHHWMTARNSSTTSRSREWRRAPARCSRR